MIVRDRPSLTQLFFIMQGSVVPMIAANIIVVIIFAAIIISVDKYLFQFPHISMSALSVFGVALSLFLGFRNNAAYDRWWEARKLWGQLISDFRNLGRETHIFLGEGKERKELLTLAGAYVHFHRGKLRNCDCLADVSRWIDSDQAKTFQSFQSPACAVLGDIAKRIHDLAMSEKISGFGQRALVERLASVSAAQAGCERIASTPLPFVYGLLVHRTAYSYCLLVPFGFIESTGWLTPLFSGFIAYVFFGLAAVTEELEHPFSKTVNGIPLDALCRTVEIGIAEALGTEPLPKHEVVDHVLT